MSSIPGTGLFKTAMRNTLKLTGRVLAHMHGQILGIDVMRSSGGHWEAFNAAIAARRQEQTGQR